MDIPEWMSGTNPVVWKALRFSTLTVCVLGILGNVSSVAVLGRHLSEIPGSRLLLALGIADLGVVTTVAARILAYVVYSYNELTRVLEWWFLYCYYCSIYLTILLSVDRYMQSAKSMLLLKINYKRIMKRVTLAVFGVMLIVTLPHLLGNLIKYHQRPHIISAVACDQLETKMCEDLKNESFRDSIPRESNFSKVVCKKCRVPVEEDQYLLAKRVLDILHQACMLKEKTNYSSLCERVPISVPAPKFSQSLAITLDHDGLQMCYNKADFMRHDPDFVKALYLGVDLPLRYIIPCVILGVVNILLVLAVRRAQIQHADITGEARVSLLKLPILKTVVIIVFVFLICHAGGSAIFILDIFRAFRARVSLGGIYLGRTWFNMFLDDSIHTHSLVFKQLGFLLASVNSAVNVVVYCLFLPVFREFWKRMHLPQMSREEAQPKAEIPAITEASLIPWEETQCTEVDRAVCCNRKVGHLLSY